MNLNEFQNGEIDNTNIIDPNLARKQQGTQNISNNGANSPRQKRVVSPRDMGFTHEEPERPKRPEDPILDSMDKAIARKQREARLLADAIDEADGEGISEEEFQDLLVQAKDEIYEDDGIPSESDLRDQAMPPKSTITMIPNENPTQDLMAELDRELKEDEADYETSGYTHFEDEEEPVATMATNTGNVGTIYPSYEGVNEEAAPATTSTSTETSTVLGDNIFNNFESGDINFDKENEELEENVDEEKLAEKEQEEQLNKLRQLVREKISPVSRGFDIRTFTISKKPAASNISAPRDNGEKLGDWVLMSGQKPIYMRRFSGAEMERLSNGGKGRTRLNRSFDTWQLIYNHIVDPNKPATLEEWAKTTSFLDIDHIFMAIYRANFEGSNYIPFNCTNENCTDKVFLSDNFDIMDMCKFKDKAAKEKFNNIIGTPTTKAMNGLYSTELVPVSDTYAFVFKEPSIYNIIFESAVLEQEFVDKFDSLISMCTYIEDIYYINHATHELQPIRPHVYPNNMKKTVKSRIIKFSKCISELDSDQYNTIIAYMNSINESGNELTYQLPEVTCPSCKTVIPATEQTAQNLVFIRHQLAALATL